jgi:hypothetical protein
MTNSKILEVLDRIYALYYHTEEEAKHLNRVELEELEHRSDELRNNPTQPWALRAAAEITFVVARKHLGKL